MKTSEQFLKLLDARCCGDMMHHIAALVVSESKDTRAYMTLTMTEHETTVCLVLKNELERQEDCHYFISDQYDLSSYGYYNMPVHALDEINKLLERID